VTVSVFSANAAGEVVSDYPQLWERGGEWIAHCLAQETCSVTFLGNRYGPAFAGDAESLWCECLGCTESFKYWGAFGIRTPDHRLGLEVWWQIGVGPCTWCGGVGRPLSPPYALEAGRILTLASSPSLLAIADELAPI
jgi:hypothetical protein